MTGTMTDAADTRETKELPPDIFEIEVIANKPIPEMFDRELARD